MKLAVSLGAVRDLLAELFSEPPDAIAPLTEGLESRAFGFEIGSGLRPADRGVEARIREGPLGGRCSRTPRCRELLFDVA